MGKVMDGPGEVHTRVNPLKIMFVVLGYWTISISMVFTNKILVGHGDSKLDLSLFVAWIQCMVTSLFVVCLNFAKKRYLYCIGYDTDQFSKYTWRMAFQKRLLLMTCSFVGMLAFNNLCLRHVGVAFYQVARSLTLIFVVILAVIMLKKRVSMHIFLCCFIVAGGFVLATDQENLAGTFSLTGSIFGVLASSLVALNGIFTKKALEVVQRDSVMLTLYTNFDAIFLFIPFVVGSGQFTAAINSNKFMDPHFWGLLLASGVLSFAIAWISAVQIDLTSPVTHHISSNAKSVLQTVIAVVYYHEHKPPLWWFSILLVIGGATAYALIRIQEEEEERRLRESVKSPALNGPVSVA